MQRGQLRPGVEPQLIRQQPPQLPVARQGLALPSGQVERPYVGGAEPFPQWMSGDEGGQVGGEQAVFAERQPGLGQLFLGHQSLFVQPGDGRAGERLVGELRVRPAAPQPEGLAQQRGAYLQVVRALGAPEQRLEATGVHGLGLGTQHVTRRPVRHQLPFAQSPAQLRDLDPQRGGGPGGRAAVPEVLDQPVGGDGPAGVDEEHGQQRPDLDLRHVDRPPVRGPHHERPQHPEPHPPPLHNRHNQARTRP